MVINFVLDLYPLRDHSIIIMHNIIIIIILNTHKVPLQLLHHVCHSEIVLSLVVCLHDTDGQQEFGARTLSLIQRLLGLNREVLYRRFDCVAIDNVLIIL